MKQIISISLGTSKNDYEFETEFLGQEFNIKRFGTDGDMDKAAEMLFEWDKEADAIAGPVLEKYEREGDPYYGSARLWDDGLIDPAATRRIVALALSACLNAPVEPSTAPVYRM